MDDVIPQSESLSLRIPSNHSPKGDEANGGEAGREEVASLSSGAEINGGDHKEGGEDEEKSGGLITNFISNLVSPRSTKSGEFAKRKVEDEVEAGEIVNGKTDQQDVGENGGGVISNMVSNFFNPSEEEKGVEVKDGGNKRLKVDEEEGGKGGLIDNIVSHLPTSVSHLPTSIPDDAAPTTDEASILIHTCVKD